MSCVSSFATNVTEQELIASEGHAEGHVTDRQDSVSSWFESFEQELIASEIHVLDRQDSVSVSSFALCLLAQLAQLMPSELSFQLELGLDRQSH